MTIASNARTKIYVCATPAGAPLTEAEYTALTWVEVGNVFDLGEWGAQGNIITRLHLGESHVGRRKGGIDSGEVALVVSRDPSDEGQTILRTSAASLDLPLPIKVQLSDKPEAGGTDSLFYFRAIVASARNSYGEADVIISTTFTLGIDGAILEIPAAEAVGP